MQLGERKDGEGGAGWWKMGKGAKEEEDLEPVFCHYSLCLSLSLSVSLVKLFLVCQMLSFYCVGFLVRFAVRKFVQQHFAHPKMTRDFSGGGELGRTDGRTHREGGMAFCVALLALWREDLGKVWTVDAQKSGLDGGMEMRDRRGEKGERGSVNKIWEGRVVTRETRYNVGLFFPLLPFSFFVLALLNIELNEARVCNASFSFISSLFMPALCLKWSFSPGLWVWKWHTFNQSIHYRGSVLIMSEKERLGCFQECKFVQSSSRLCCCQRQVQG